MRKDRLSSVLIDIYGTALECASYLNQKEDPIGTALDAIPGFLPSLVGLVVLNALPGIWQYNVGLKQYISQPIRNAIYPQQNPSRTCTTTVTSTSEFPVATSSASTITCDGNRYPQACQHYASVINEAPGGIINTLYCAVSSTIRSRRLPGLWNTQHTSDWNYWVPQFNKPNGKPDKCNRDEYPPFAFQYPAESQWLRFLCAGNLWSSICLSRPRLSTTVVEVLSMR